VREQQARMDAQRSGDRTMNTSRLNFWTLTLFAAVVVVGLTALSRADDPREKPASATQPSTQPDEAGPMKFYGTISAIDTKAMTFTVDNQVFSVVPETHMTKAADDSQATLADASVGEPARGTYTRSSDGKLNVTKVRFGKKTGGKAGGGKAGGKKKQGASTQPEKS
jgi:hypothetical protein